MMFEIKNFPTGIIQVIHEGYFTLDHWVEYKRIMMHLLDDADDKVYILSDFSRTERFDNRVILEAGTAPHLTHEKLGLIVLYGGSQLNNFVLQIAQNRAQRQNRHDKLRLHNDYEQAIQILLNCSGKNSNVTTVTTV